LQAARIANTANEFAEEVLRLLELSPGVRRGIAASSDLRELTWARTLAPLWSVVERAAGASHARGQCAVAHIAWRSASL